METRENPGVYRERFQLDGGDTDLFLRLKTGALFRRLQNAAMHHAELLGVGMDALLAHNALWMVSRMGMEAERLPVYGEWVSVETWPGKPRHTIFPRYYRMLDQQGNLLVTACAMWHMVDRATRHMLPPGAVGLALPSVETGLETPLPGSFRLPALTGETSRTAHYSELDRNGHVNNACYLDWLDDLFDPAWHRDHWFSALQIQYAAELPYDSRVRLRFTGNSGGSFALQGFREEEPAFQLAAKVAEMSHGGEKES